MKTLGSVESFTGGMFASKIVDKPGASKYFKGSVVSYSNEIKEKLGIDTSKGVINKQVAVEMAIKGKEYLGVDICVSFTGNAGPETLENKEIGNIYIAINEQVYDLKFDGNRQQIREKAVGFALEKVNELI